MPALAQSAPSVSLRLIAGLILAALDHLGRLGLPCPTATQVLEALGVGRTQAYAQRTRVQEALTGLDRPPGRPPAAPPPQSPECGTQTLSLEVLRFVLAHPGCVSGGTARQQYSEGFRRFVLELRARHAELDLATFAEATAIPAGTIEDCRPVDFRTDLIRRALRRIHSAYRIPFAQRLTAARVIEEAALPIESPGPEIRTEPPRREVDSGTIADRA